MLSLRQQQSSAIEKYESIWVTYESEYNSMEKVQELKNKKRKFDSAKQESELHRVPYAQLNKPTIWVPPPPPPPPPHSDRCRHFLLPLELTGISSGDLIAAQKMISTCKKTSWCI